jgi:hypothetical protein
MLEFNIRDHPQLISITEDEFEAKRGGNFYGKGVAVPCKEATVKTEHGALLYSVVLFNEYHEYLEYQKQTGE